MKPTRNAQLSTLNAQPDPEMEIQEPDGLWLGLLIWLHIAWSWLREKLTGRY